MSVLYLYVILVKSKKFLSEKVSQEAYVKYKDVLKFLKSRSDCPTRIDSFKYESEDYEYLIYKVFAENK